MRLAAEKNDSESRYFLEITARDFREMKFQLFDADLLAECEASSKISDKLLALELLARRFEEGAKYEV